MPQPVPIIAPSGYAAAHAVGYSDSTRNLALVSDAARLPVAISAPPPPPLTGTTDQPLLAGPFEATAGRVITVALDGQWQGTVRLLRSTDSGATKLPLLVGGVEWGAFSASGCEQAWVETEEGASYFLDIALESGTLAYRVSQ